MNFLGHLYLSGDHPLVITGNFMADAVKGRDMSGLHPLVAEGVRLHRRIDAFTDSPRPAHPGRIALVEHAGRYAPVVLDMFFDHLLASEWSRWHPEPLPAFAGRMYALLQEHSHLMPERTRAMLPYMVAGDWLSSYARIEGLGRALDGLSRRVAGGARMEGAEQVLVRERKAFEDEFEVFLPALKGHLAQFA
jgi:acyl carrier protein phosphodiesterase